jgi:D-psicose/D-tagatose/L-ribulose 3-epimerase
MKIGFCMLSWAEAGDAAMLPLCEGVKATGYDGIEIPIIHDTRDDYAALAHRLDAIGLERTALTVMPRGKNPISDDTAERQAAVDHVMWVLDCTADLGASMLVGPVHQTLGEFTGLPPSATEMARLRDFHRRAGDIAAERGITIAVEPMNRFECHVLNTMDSLAGYLVAVDHPAVTGMYDTFHANIEEADPVDALTRHAHHVGHFHVSESDRGVPGRGHVPWNATFAALKHAGYDGWLTVESFGRSNPALAAATRVWRNLAESAEAVYRDGYRHVRTGWDAG